MDADHLDIYGTAEAVEVAFIEFANRVKSNGLLIRKHGLNRLNEAGVRKQLTYQLHAGVTHQVYEMFLTSMMWTSRMFMPIILKPFQVVMFLMQP
jgi:UDP-N-acetylmuramate-alanine ligase